MNDGNDGGREATSAGGRISYLAPWPVNTFGTTAVDMILWKAAETEEQHADDFAVEVISELRKKGVSP